MAFAAVLVQYRIHERTQQGYRESTKAEISPATQMQIGAARDEAARLRAIAEVEG
jgi:hypothetical protein